jgi:hypothetical protein
MASTDKSLRDAAERMAALNETATLHLGGNLYPAPVVELSLAKTYQIQQRFKR